MTHTQYRLRGFNCYGIWIASFVPLSGSIPIDQSVRYSISKCTTAVLDNKRVNLWLQVTVSGESSINDTFTNITSIRNHYIYVTSKLKFLNVISVIMWKCVTLTVRSIHLSVVYFHASAKLTSISSFSHPRQSIDSHGSILFVLQSICLAKTWSSLYMFKWSFMRSLITTNVNSRRWKIRYNATCNNNAVRHEYFIRPIVVRDIGLRAAANTPWDMHRKN